VTSEGLACEVIATMVEGHCPAPSLPEGLFFQRTRWLLYLDLSLQQALLSQRLDVRDLEIVRLILEGNSVIDWNRVRFTSRTDVDRFLDLHLIDLDDPEDLRRIRFVHAEAVNYLQEHLGLHFPEDIKNPEDIRDLFVMASETGRFRRRQIQACVILKLMHVINHLEAAELRFQTPLSEADLLDLAERRIVAAADKLREQGFPIVSFYGSRKTRNSIITKLLAKKDTIAATIFDKLRFRVVTREVDQVLPAVSWLKDHLFPFNYVIPGQSHNNLVSLKALLEKPDYSALQKELAPFQDTMVPDDNPFSGASYRMINFIVDFPVRVDHLVNVRYGSLLGRTVFVLVEFQVLDEATAKANDEGENAHELYKERQNKIVASRLRKGVAATE
jgi:uncharacterized protein (TIGR04552 family)